MSRAEILGAIRRGLRRGALPADQTAMLAARTAMHRRHIIPARGQLDLAGRIDLFTHYAEREFATLARLQSYGEIPEAVAAYLAGQNIPPAIVVAPHPALQGIPFDTKPMLDVRYGVSGPDDLVSLQAAFAGIAETGTLMLPSGPTRPASNNLLPDTAIVVLPAEYVVGCYEDAFDALRELGAMPRNVMLVTGPSRSADIEQTLELGAHGPRRLHILIVDGFSGRVLDWKGVDGRVKPGRDGLMARSKNLSKADLRLWAAFTETIALLPGKARLAVEPEPVTAVEIVTPALAPTAPGKKLAAEFGVNQVPGGLDKSTWKSFATGKIRAVRRLDLHGLTATRAHTAVTNFVERAYGEQIRCVEIITGKGEVLARELPHWLNSPGLRARILAVAHPHAGNTGSVRILLRRDRQAVDAGMRRHDVTRQ